MAATKEHEQYKLVTKEEANAIAWSFEGPNTQPLVYPFKFPALLPHEIRVQQTYFGLCYTDCHLVNQDWFPVPYPLVPGHEILGKVVAKGAEVSQYQLGDLVGIGFIRDSCGKCKLCHTGHDQLCGQAGAEHLIPIPKFGGFATHVQAPAKWAFPIPNTIPQEVCPPLLCAGITVYAPLKRFFGPNKKVAIIGIGGLGHMAIKFSAALGMRTTAVSTTPAKEAEARSYGAVEFINSKDSKQMNQASKQYDLVLTCAHSGSTADFIQQVSLVKNGGDFVMVGIPHVNATELSIPFYSLVCSQISIVGSLVGSREENYEMLEFAAKHKIYPTCEQFEFNDFPKAYDYLLNGQPRYRCVVKVGAAGEGLQQ